MFTDAGLCSRSLLTRNCMLSPVSTMSSNIIMCRPVTSRVTGNSSVILPVVAAPS